MNIYCNLNEFNQLVETDSKDSQFEIIYVTNRRNERVYFEVNERKESNWFPRIAVLDSQFKEKHMNESIAFKCLEYAELTDKILKCHEIKH